MDASGKLAFAVEDHGKWRRIETDGRLPLSAGEWYSVSLSVDSAGWGVFQVNGEAAGDVQRVTVPRTCLRLHNQVGRFNQELEGAPSPLQGEIGVLRLWNRALTSSEVRTFHQTPLSVPKHPLRSYHRSVMEYRNGRPYLVSGMSDGSTPPVPLFELAVDKGLTIQSKSTTAHANLLAAQHTKQAVDEKAAADRATAQRDAHDRQSDAQASNQAAHAQAQRKLDAANASAAQQRADAHQRLAAASQLAEQKKNAARENARQQKADAEQRAQRIKDSAQASADSIKRSANKQLQDAQTDKANQEARRG